MTLTGYMYVCSGGETFDSIAWDLWGDENRAAELLCANPEHATRQVFLGGEELYIPEVEVQEMDADLTTTPEKAPWRE